MSLAIETEFGRQSRALPRKSLRVLDVGSALTGDRAAIEALALECKRGDVVLMSRFTPHRSTPNYSDQCRWSLDLRYQTTGEHTGRTGHPDFIARSRRDPTSELTDYNEWCHRWVDAFENPRGVVMHRGE